MYDFILGLHNIVRWLVVLGGIYALIMAYRGLFSQATWTDSDKRAGLIFTSALNLQFVIGIILFIVSPLIQGAMQNMSAAMQNDQTRFFIAEHTLMMLLAVIAAQVGYTLAKRAPGDRGKFVRAAVGYTISAILIVVAIPWWRPLFPGLG